jgi:hypothetical protein
VNSWFLLKAGVAKEQKFSRRESREKTGVMWERI